MGKRQLTSTANCVSCVALCACVSAWECESVCLCACVYRLRCHANQRRGRNAAEAPKRFWLAVPQAKLSHTRTHLKLNNNKKEIVKQKQQRIWKKPQTTTSRSHHHHTRKNQPTEPTETRSTLILSQSTSQPPSPSPSRSPLLRVHKFVYSTKLDFETFFLIAATAATATTAVAAGVDVNVSADAGSALCVWWAARSQYYLQPSSASDCMRACASVCVCVCVRTRLLYW